MRTVRLVKELIQRGWEDEEVEMMGRSQLEDEWAKVVAQGGDTPPEPEVVNTEILRTSALESSQQTLERERLAFEQRRYEEEKIERKRRDEEEKIERKEREEKEERERRRREEKEERERKEREEKEERELRRREEKEERERREREEERRRREEKEDEEKKKEFELRTQQLELERQRLKQSADSKILADEDRTLRRSLASRIKFFNDALKGTVGKLPTDSAQIPIYLNHLEKVFETIGVDEDCKASILLTNLNDRARMLTSRLTTQQMSSYTALKEFLLKEHRISAIQLRERFLSTRKTADETYVGLASRLHTTLHYYVESRNVGEDYDTLIDLLCADRLKELLPREALNFVLTQEQESWMKTDQLANSVDTFMATRYSGGEHNKNIGSTSSQAGHQPKATNEGGHGAIKKTGTSGYSKTEPKISKEEALQKGLCFKCGIGGHRSFECEQKKGAEASPKVVKVKACKVVSPEGANLGKVNTDERGSEDGTATQAILSSSRTTPEDTKPQNLVIDTDEFYPRTYVQINIEGLGPHRALVDSGAEVCCLRGALAQDLQLPIHRQIRVVGMNGHAEVANVVRVHARPMVAETRGLTNVAPAVRIWMASVDGLAEDVIITPSVMSALQESTSYNVMATNFNRLDDSNDESEADTVVDISTHRDVMDEANEEIAGEQETVPPASEMAEHEIVDNNGSESPVFLDTDQPAASQNTRVADADTLSSEQRKCALLRPYFEKAKQSNSKFFLKDKLLYRRDQIVGHHIEQLCLPESRIGIVLESAHEAPFAGHMAAKTTRDRIRLSFWFPNMEERIQNHCASCSVCQLRAPVKTSHRVPIQAIPRNDELPFSSIAADCIGPLIAEGDPTIPKPEYNYALVMVDRFSRWPMAFPLRTMTAKAVCDAFIQTFMTFSVPKTITTDCGTNFTSKLTQELLKRLGCCPRFTTPGHPEANGLVERCNGSIKSMIYKLAQDDPRGWHKLLPYVLWGLRERPSATTHVSPYMLVYGTTPRGPLAILKESWMGERELPFSIGKTPEQYLQSLKENLELARAYAEYYSDVEQKRMTEYYNLRSMDRRYAVGEKVIILAPDSKGAKLFNRWQGPGTVVEVKSPYSYIVEIDGRRKHVHANKIRKYNERIQEALVNNCAVIFERDREFGHVAVISADDAETIRPSQSIEAERISHLSTDEQSQLLALLDRYPMVFTKTPGFCALVEHEMELLPSFVPRRLKAYRIPELLKPEVDRQIKKMLGLDIIEPSTSEVASPIVCVLKGPDGKGGVRLAIDHRHIKFKYRPGKHNLVADFLSRM